MSDVAYLIPGKREQTKLANRQAILDAARAVFRELGYEAATVRDIIRRTGLSVGAFYNYYRSKEEVFAALADDGARRFRPILHAEYLKADDFEILPARRDHAPTSSSSPPRPRPGQERAAPTSPRPTRATRPRCWPCTTRCAPPSPT